MSIKESSISLTKNNLFAFALLMALSCASLWAAGPEHAPVLMASAKETSSLAGGHSVEHGAIAGKVSDPSGTPLPGATVTLTLSGDAVATVTTDEQGGFALRAAAGDYQLLIAAEGMETLVVEAPIRAEHPLQITRKLKIATLSSTVRVVDNGYQAETQSTATRMNIRPLDVPQTVTTITQEALRDRMATSMQEALAYTPSVSQILGEGRRDQFSIRGMNTTADNYIDGVKDDATYYRDLSNTDHIEVVGGPAAVLYGRGNSGGLINRVTKHPRMAGTLAQMQTTYGSYGSKRVEGDVDTLLGSPKLGLRMTGGWEEGGSYRHGYSLGRYAFSPTMTWKISPTQALSVQVEHLRDERTPDRGIPSINGRPAPVSAGTSYGYTQYDGKTRTDHIHGGVTDETLDYKLRAAGWELHTLFRRSDYNVNYQNTFVSAVSGSKVTRGEYDGQSLQSNNFSQSEASRKFTLFGMEHLALIGVEYGHQSSAGARHTGSAAAVALNNPAQTAPTLSSTLANSTLFIGQDWGGYAQDQITLARHWKALIGVRMDDYRQGQRNRLKASDHVARRDTQPSPRAGIVYQPDERTSLYASWSHTFDPSGETLSLSSATSNNTASLPPEKTDNYEIGAKRQFLSNRVTATASLYRLNRTDVKVPDYASDPTGATYRNAGVMRTDGFEANLSGRITQRWQMTGGWAWMDARYEKNSTISNGVALQGKRAQLIPVNSGSLWQSFDIKKNFGVGLGVVAMNSRFASTTNAVKLPGFARLDASAYYRTRHWDLDLHIENLADRRYYATAQADQQIMPGSPISAKMAFRVRF